MLFYTFFVLKVFEPYMQLATTMQFQSARRWYSFALFVHLLFFIVMYVGFLELLYVASSNHFRLIMHDLF